MCLATVCKVKKSWIVAYSAEKHNKYMIPIFLSPTLQLFVQFSAHFHMHHSISCPEWWSMTEEMQTWARCFVLNLYVFYYIQTETEKVNPSLFIHVCLKFFVFKWSIYLFFSPVQIQFFYIDTNDTFLQWYKLLHLLFCHRQFWDLLLLYW